MAKSASDVLSGITNINNIKYNNNNKDIKNLTTTSIVSKENNIGETTTSCRVGFAASPKEETLVSNGTLPAKWKGVKIDLFSNPGYTLKISIIRHDGTRFPCSSQMNSPRSYVFRGRTTGQGSEEHWQLVEHLMELRKNEDYRISKVSQMKKGGTIEDFACLIYQKDSVWNADLIYEHQIWSFVLDNSLTPAFQKKNGIASGYAGITGYSKPWVSGKELGI
jgi:hypothetical protein